MSEPAAKLTIRKHTTGDHMAGHCTDVIQWSDGTWTATCLAADCHAEAYSRAYGPLRDLMTAQPHRP